MSWCVSHIGGCVDRHVAVVVVVLRTVCSTVPVVSVADKALFYLTSVNTNEEGSLCVGRVVRNFLLLSNSAGDFNWWSTGVLLYNIIPK